MTLLDTSKNLIQNDFCIEAFDPGGTTGYCRVLIRDRQIFSWHYYQFTKWYDVEKILDDVPDENYRRVIMYETFTIRTMAAKLIPVEVIGVIKHEARKRKITLYPKTPASRKMAENRFPIQTRITMPHAKDALFHVVTYIYTNLHLIHMPDFTVANEKTL